MKFSVCVDALYSGKNFFESLKSAKSAGLDAIEFWTWWDKDLPKVKAACDELGLNVATFCNKFISLTDESSRVNFIEALRQSIEAAKYLGAGALITQVGNDTGAPRSQQHESIVDGLKACIPVLEQSGITLLIEPLNTLIDHKGYYLWSSDEAFEIADEANSPYIKVLFDIYHQQIMEGNLISRITKNIEMIGHIHAAGVPGRHELDTGEINYPEIFEAIRQTGYKGYIGLEYFPLRDPQEGLTKLKEACRC